MSVLVISGSIRTPGEPSACLRELPRQRRDLSGDERAFRRHVEELAAAFFHLDVRDPAVALHDELHGDLAGYDCLVALQFCLIWLTSSAGRRAAEVRDVDRRPAGPAATGTQTAERNLRGRPVSARAAPVVTSLPVVGSSSTTSPPVSRSASAASSESGFAVGARRNHLRRLLRGWRRSRSGSRRALRPPGPACAAIVFMPPGIRPFGAAESDHHRRRFVGGAARPERRREDQRREQHACAASDSTTIRLMPSAICARSRRMSLTASRIVSGRRLGHETDLFDAGFLQPVGHGEEILRGDGRFHAEEHRLVVTRDERLLARVRRSPRCRLPRCRTGAADCGRTSPGS